MFFQTCYIYRWEYVAGQQKKLRHPTRPAEDINKLTKGVQEQTQLIGRGGGGT